MFDGLIRIFDRRFSGDRHYYRLLYKIFGVTPRNIELYKLALVHRSASVVMENGEAINNERLEFLGDAVLETITSEMLFIEYPDKNEGTLTQLRARIVSRSTLNQLALDMELDSEIIAHPTTVNTQKQNIYGDAFEALIGALYLDKGYNRTNRIIIDRIFRRHLDLDELTSTEQDFKSRVIEWAQKSHKRISFESREGSGHTDANPNFESILTIDGKEEGYGAGHSKKEAEQRAAKQAYETLG